MIIFQSSLKSVNASVTSQEMGKKFFTVRVKSGNFILSQGKLKFFEEKSEKIENISLLIYMQYYLRLEEKFQVTVTDLNNVIAQ